LTYKTPPFEEKSEADKASPEDRSESRTQKELRRRHFGGMTSLTAIDMFLIARPGRAILFSLRFP
jgi:hypothetical protein